MRKFLSKRFYTTGSIAESLIVSAIEKQGVKVKFDDLVSWEDLTMSSVAKTTKGGLNKAFVKTPMLAKNVDQYDISGAYSTAMKFFELPFSEPQNVHS